MQTAGDFLVYSCPSCGKRIFTQKRFQGRHGSCPLCGDSHLVGGAPEVLLTEDEPSGVTTAEEAPDRRGAKRVRPRHSQGVEDRPARRLQRRRRHRLDPPQLQDQRPAALLPRHRAPHRGHQEARLVASRSRVHGPRA